MNTLVSCMAVIASGVLVWLAMPEYSLTALVWVALVPLLLVLVGCRDHRGCFLTGYGYGLVYAALCVKWITVAPGFPLAGYLVMVAWIALFPALFALALGTVTRRTAWPLWLAAPLLWTAVEYLRVIIPLAPSPLALLGHVFYRQPDMIQLAAVTSAYGPGFLIVLVNAALACLVLAGYRRLSRRPPVQSPGQLLLAGLLALFSPLAVLILGQARLSQPSPGPEPLMRVAAVQANIPQEEKWRTDKRQEVLDRHAALSRQAILRNPGLVVWPETAVPADMLRKIFIREYMKALARELAVPLLAGSATGDKDGSGGDRKFTATNSAYLIDRQGEVVDAYNKIRLLPFAERIPFGEKFPWPDWMIPAKRSFTPGKGIHLLQLDGVHIGVVICWENLFPDLFRRYVDAGAQLMVNMTNEAWFGDSEGGYYLLASAVFRALENGVALLRVANTGVSALIGPRGTILQRITDAEGNDLMVAGILNATVPVPLHPTFYRRFGDVFAIACALLSLVLLFSSFHRTRTSSAHKDLIPDR